MQKYRYSDNVYASFEIEAKNGKSGLEAGIRRWLPPQASTWRASTRVSDERFEVETFGGVGLGGKLLSPWRVRGRGGGNIIAT